MKKTFSILSLCALYFALFSSCDDPFDGEMFVTPTDLENEMSCTTVMEKHADDFSMWIELLKYADYYNGLKDAKAKATVFAPTNKAIEDFLAWRGVSTIEELGVGYARSVVQTHIINCQDAELFDSESIVNAAVEGANINRQTLFQSYLKPTFGYVVTDVDDAERTGEVLNEGTLYINNQAAVQPRDSGGVNVIEAANAMIYYMDDVIHPLVETIVDKMEQLGDCNIFAAAIRESGYDDVASRLRDTIRVTGGGTTIRTYSYTCFAPSDDALRAEGISSVADLKSKLGGDAALRSYVEYHFFNQSYTTDVFFDIEYDGQVRIYDTNYTGEVVTCQEADGVRTLNDGIHVLRSDIEARNGYIHKIDGWLPVFRPEPVEIKWDFCNAPEIISFVNAYGEAHSLGELYSNAITQNYYQIDLLYNEGEMSYRDGQFGTITEDVFTYKCNREYARSGAYRRVGYKKCEWVSVNDRERNPYFGDDGVPAYLNNLLELNLGYAGWVQFTTPTIIRGKYRVTLHYASETSLKPYHTSGTQTRFQIDPDSENSYSRVANLYRGFPTGRSVRQTAGDEVLWTEVEFDGSSKHFFKAMFLDNKASTDNDYHQLWDYVLFTPIE